jgi:hypothetical protein
MKKIQMFRKLLSISVISLLLFASIPGNFTLSTHGEDRGKIRILSEKLPFPRLGTSAIWDGNNVYIFGGVVDENGSFPMSAKTVGDILKFNPESENLRIMDTTLPSNRSSTSALWSGKYVYILGGDFTDPETGRELYDDHSIFNITCEELWCIFGL